MNEATIAAAEVKSFRGGSLEDLLPRIRAELGPNAVIVRQREGLVGGVGGFFQKKCVEVEARAGGPGVDVYDEQPADEVSEAPVPPPADELELVRNDAATREGLATPAVQELVGQAHPFAEMLAAVEPPAEIEGPPKARALVDGMTRAGLGDDLARELVEAVLANALPFATPARLRTLVRNELALRIPVAPAAAPGPRTLVFVGPAGAGKTAALAAIAAAHEAAGDDGLELIDTPALHGSAAELSAVAASLRDRDGTEVHLVLRAGTAAAAAAEAIDGLAPLGPTRLLMTGAGETAHLGGVVDAAIRSGLPLSYIAESAGELAPADPRALAGRIVP